LLGVFCIGIAQAQDNDPQPSSSEEETVLPTVSVTAAPEPSAITEGSGSYTTPQMGTATKLPLSIRETPQSVTVITRDRMDDQGMATLTDVLRYTPGINVGYGDGSGRPSFSARGFNIDNIMADGQPSHFENFWGHGVLPNMGMYDRVEVVRGATGLVTGSGNPSAAVNAVRKRPTITPQTYLTAQAGRWDNYLGEADISGPLNAAGTLRARVVASYQDAGTFRDDEKYKHGLFYAVAEVDLGERTTLTLGVSYQDDYTNHPWGDLPLTSDGRHMGLPRSTNPAIDWEHRDQYLTTVFGELQHRFDNDWQLHLKASQSWQDTMVIGAYLERLDSVTNDYSTTGVLKHWAYRGDYDQKYFGYDLSASGPFHLLGRKHELAFGSSRRQADYVTQNYQGSLVSSDIDLWNWNNGSIAKPNFTRTDKVQDITTQDGFYLTTRLNLADPLKLILGARLDWYDYNSRRTGGYHPHGDDDYKVTRQLTRYGGLIYDFDKRHSVYASYSDIFQPQTNKGLDGKIIEPIVGKNYEIGVKGEYFDGALNASAAVFRIEETNRASRLTDQSGCPTSWPECYEASGLVRSKGFDLEIQGALTPNWELAAGYTYHRVESDLPPRQFKLSTLYRFTGALQGWRVGGSLYYQNRTYVDVDGNGTILGRNQQKAYTLADLVVGYRVNKQFDVQLNVNNLFDRRYYKGLGYSTVWGPTDVYGDPRNFTLTARYQF
jgi:outer membrane receptor for ferric coprogen and ferric-rhodotorulic acid